MRLSLSGLIDRWFAPAPDPRKVAWIGDHTYAHRGLHGETVPENSMAAARGAIGAGLGIECDIQRSLDDCPMVFHDWDLERLVGVRGETSSMTAKELMALRYVGSDEGPVALGDLLDLLQGQVPLLIEIKSRHGYDVQRTCQVVRDALAGIHGHHAVMSFDPRVSRWFARHSPESVRGLVVTEEEDKTWVGAVRRRLSFWHARPDFLAYDIRDLPNRFVEAQRTRGLPVATWTVRSPELAARAARYADAPIAEGAGLEAVS